MAGNAILNRAARQVEETPATPVRAPVGGAAPPAARGMESEEDIEMKAALPPVTTNNYLLLIAIDHYEKLPVLKNAVRDANALLEVLSQNYHFTPALEDVEYIAMQPEGSTGRGAYTLLRNKELKNGKNRYRDKEGEIKVYHDPRIVCLYNEDVTAGNVSDALSKLMKQINEDAKEGVVSQLLVYYAGHGATNEDGNYVLLTGNYDAYNSDSYITMDRIFERFKRKNNCDNFLLVIDACGSGDAISGVKGQVADMACSRNILMAAKAHQNAADGFRNKDGSPFSFALCKVLEEAATPLLAAEDMREKMQRNIDRIFRDQKIAQQVRYGLAPTEENGSQSFIFQRREQRSPPTALFLNSFIEKLNFTKPRDTILDNFFAGAKIDYAIVSMTGGKRDLHSIQSLVMLNEILTLRHIGAPAGERIKRVEYANGSSLEQSFVNTLNLSETGDVAIDYAKIIAESLTLRPESDQAGQHPLFLVFYIDNSFPDEKEVLEFCRKLITGVEAHKKENHHASYDPLFIFLCDGREGLRNYYKEVDKNTLLADEGLVLMTFDSERLLPRGQAERWHSSADFAAFPKFQELTNDATAFNAWFTPQNGFKTDIVKFIVDSSLYVGIKENDVMEQLFLTH